MATASVDTPDPPDPHGREHPPRSAEAHPTADLTLQAVFDAVSRLADLVRRQAADVAAAAERQRATDERVAELVRANDALRRITDRLGGSEDITDFLSAALSEVCDASGAISAAVFVFDPAAHTLQKMSFVWRGQPLDVPTDPRLELWRPPVPADVTDCWKRMLEGDQPVWTDLEAPPPDQWTFATAWHQMMGHRLMAAFPLRVGGQPVGFLRLCFDTPLRPTVAKLEQCQTLAQQAALALQMSRTAAKARTAAVAIEHERAARERLGELVAANRILVNSLDGFTANPNPDDFLAKVLMQLAEVLGVPVVELWYARESSGVVYPGPMYHAGRTVSPDESDHPMRHTGYRIPTSYELIDAVDHHRHILWDRLSDHPQVPAEMWAWYRERFGVDKMINLPLVVGRKVIGAAIGFAPDRHAHTDSQLELGHALAAQLALALQLGELSERAKAVAVLEVKEQSARERAAELEELNAVLTRGAERVAEADDLGGVVVGFLHEAKAVTGAYCAAAFRRVEAARHVPLAVIVGDHVLTPEELESSPLFVGFADRSARDHGGLYSRLARGEVVYAAVDECEPCLYPEAVAYHRTVGNVMVWHLPFMLGGDLQGYVALGMQRDDSPSDSEQRTLRAIRQHMTLAFELHRLADQERRAAVLGERARLARDIHDTLAQGFLGILLHLETVRRTLTTDSGRATRAVDQAYTLAQSCLNEARRSVGMLRVASTELTDLAVTLSLMVREAAERGDFPIRFDTPLTACPISSVVAEHILRIVAEAVQNARRHARPTQVRVSLARENGVVRVAVSDDGVGFHPESVSASGRYGLLGMRERADLAGCELVIWSAPGQGTTVTVRWPRTDTHWEQP